MSLIITKAGLLALNAAEASGTKLQATHMAVGDGAGQTPEHTNASTELVNEVWRGALDAVTLREDGQTESGQAVEFRAHIPMTTGGWYIREVAIYADDVLLAIGAHPVMWKPAPDDPTKLEHTIYAPVVFGNAGTLALTIDPSKVLATRQAVEEEIAAHNNSPEAHGEAFKALAYHIEDQDDPHATLPPGGETGQVIIKQEDGSLAWGSVAGVPVGQLCFSTTANPLPGTVPVNVKQKYTRDVYPQLVAFVQASGGYLANEAAWDAEAAAQEGTCGRYCLTDTHIILPCYKHYFASAQDGVAGKGVGDWAGDELLAHLHNNGVGDLDDSHNIYGTTTEDVPGGIIKSAQSYNYVPTFQGLTSTTGGSENHVKRSYVLPCIKVADVAVNASQVDMLALASQVAAINGDKVDKGDAEYRSIVELKGSRGAAGTWTIPDLIVGKPLFVSLTDTSDDGVLYRVVSGALDAFTTSTSRYHGMASRANFTNVTPSSFVLVPTATAVEIYIQSIQTGATLRAYQ